MVMKLGTLVLTFCFSSVFGQERAIAAQSRPQVSKIQYLDRGMKLDFRTQFAKAIPVSPSHLEPGSTKAESKTTLSCSMYGMRSGLQVEEDVLLYQFRMKPTEVSGTKEARRLVSNEGAQVVRTYEFGVNGLEGNNGSLKDVVRFDPNQKGWIGELSLPKSLVNQPQDQQIESAVDPNRVVIAYAVCH